MQAEKNNELLQNTLSVGKQKKTMRMLTYIRPLKAHEGTGYAVCSEHGNILAKFANRKAAYYTAIQFKLIPQVLH